MERERFPSLIPDFVYEMVAARDAERVRPATCPARFPAAERVRSLRRGIARPLGRGGDRRGRPVALRCDIRSVER